jgi:hypothetical protein
MEQAVAYFPGFGVKLKMGLPGQPETMIGKLPHALINIDHDNVRVFDTVDSD